ncbi:MAG: bifunctional (p)ppGpp synthetase/guanosine-3',5'-bis(diphosphate) 3'-pyrophosphohydrolase, partial [Candidatus Aminicenantes bacterium]|nr:bifunctional (p)ppGpp synthetase/guanosine-3',5'-bis(diphosphate) 3'-pyrophosphohydrolase [Candidatus Aminicenantes bacterium]
EKDINRLRRAYIFSASVHKGQVRRSGEPYLSHPLDVANQLAEMKLGPTSLIAGLLHDVLEDTDITLPELRKAFGQEVADLVEGVTKISRVQESSPERQQAETIRKIILAMTGDLRVIFIKLADRLHNLKTLKFLPPDKQKRIAQETLDIYAPLANRLGMGRIKAELEDLAFRYVAPDDYFKTASLIEGPRKKAETELARLEADLGELMKRSGIPAEICSRVKRPYSIYNKMKKRGLPFDQVYDFLALRLITDSEPNCYASLGVIHRRWPHLPHRFRDFIAMPKPNLYQALHTTIITESRRTFEIQVRTREMHTLAENGIAAHWKYKEPDSAHLLKEDRRLSWLREMVDIYKEQPNPREFLKNLKADLVPEEVSVFTPKGERVTLPAGASVLDFAFRIHTHIGLRCSGGRVNGKTAPLKTILKTGDIVEIQTADEPQPKPSWLNIAFTSTARHHIKRWLNMKEREASVALGKRIWERKMKRLQLPAVLRREEGLLRRLVKISPVAVKSLEDFFGHLGRGRVLLDARFLEKLVQAPGGPAEKKTLFPFRRRGAGLEGRGVAGALFRLARCCAPVRGEPIIGYITAGKGITAHALRCPLMRKEVLNSQRLVEVSWDSFAGKTFRAKVRIGADDSPGMLAKVTAAVTEAGSNIWKAEAATLAEGKVDVRLALDVRDIRHYEDVTARLRKIKGVETVERI